MSSIISFLRPVVVSFVFCTLASWGAAQFKAELAQSTLPRVAAVTEKAIDATSPAILAASLPAGLPSSASFEVTAESAADSNSEDSLFVAPTQTSLDDAAVRTEDEHRRPSERTSHSRPSRGAVSATMLAQPWFDTPSLAGPHSLSVYMAPVVEAHEATILHDANEFQSVVTMGLQSLVVENRKVLGENQGDAAVGAIVGTFAATGGEDDATRLDAVPEPSGLALAALGLTGWLLTRRRESRVAK